VVVGNECVCVLSFTIERKLACVGFPSWCNNVFGNALMLILEGKIAGVSFPSWCNVFHGNAFLLVIEDKLACIDFLRGAMLFLTMHLFLWGELPYDRFPS
jgi:hypothetical protein